MLLAGTMVLWRTTQAFLGIYLPTSGTAGQVVADTVGTAEALLFSGLLTLSNAVACILSLLAVSEWHRLRCWLSAALSATAIDLALRCFWDLPSLAALRGKSAYFAASTTVMEAMLMTVLLALLVRLALRHRACCCRGAPPSPPPSQAAQAHPQSAEPPPPPPPRELTLEEVGVAGLWKSYRLAVHPAPRLWLRPLTASSCWRARGAVSSAPSSVFALLSCAPLRIHFGALVTAFVLFSLAGQLDGTLLGVRDLLEQASRVTDDTYLKLLINFLITANTSAQAAFWPALFFALCFLGNSLLGAARDHVHVMASIHAAAHAKWARGKGGGDGDGGDAAPGAEGARDGEHPAPRAGKEDAALTPGGWAPGSPPPPHVPPPDSLATFSYLPVDLAYAAPSGELLPPERWPHEVPDVVGSGRAAGFVPAFKVPAIFIALHLLAFVFLLLFFIVALFVVLFQPIREYVIDAAVVAGVSAVLNSLFHYAITWVFTRDGVILCPRAFLFVDTLYSLSVGLATGLAAAVLRLGVGLAALAASLPMMHKPGARDVGALAAADGVFVAYMSMLRCRYHQVLEVTFGRECCGCGCECKGCTAAKAPREEAAPPAAEVVPNPLAGAVGAGKGGGAAAVDEPAEEGAVGGSLPGSVGSAQEWPSRSAV